MKRTIFLMFLVILLLTVFGCGDVKDNNVTPSDTTATTTEAPATDTTKTEETTAPPETEQPIIWASEPDPFMIAIVPNPGTVDLGSQLAEALKVANEDAVIGVAFAGSFDVDYGDSDIEVQDTYLGKTTEEYFGIYEKAYVNWSEARDNALAHGCTEEEADQAEEVIVAYDKYLKAYETYVDASAYMLQPFCNKLQKKFEPMGFKFEYDLSNESMREYLHLYQLYSVFTVSVKDFNEFIRSVGNTEEAYIFCLAMELNDGG